jgi:hypothetical protein
MVDAQRSFMLDVQRRRDDSSRAQKPADLTHTDLQLLQLLLLKARAHDAQAIADTGTDLTVERAVRHGPDSFAEGLDDLPEVGKSANSELLSLHRVLSSASGTFLRHFFCDISAGLFKKVVACGRLTGLPVAEITFAAQCGRGRETGRPVRCAGLFQTPSATITVPPVAGSAMSALKMADPGQGSETVPA